MRARLSLLAVMVLASFALWSQTSTGTAGGTVRDQTSVIIPNASAILLNTATNVRSTTTSNEAGFYRFPGVVPGQYRLSTESAGMQKSEGNLTVQVGQSVVVDPPALLRPKPVQSPPASSVDSFRAHLTRHALIQFQNSAFVQRPQYVSVFGRCFLM